MTSHEEILDYSIQLLEMGESREEILARLSEDTSNPAELSEHLELVSFIRQLPKLELRLSPEQDNKVYQAIKGYPKPQAVRRWQLPQLAQWFSVPRLMSGVAGLVLVLLAVFWFNSLPMFTETEELLIVEQFTGVVEVSSNGTVWQPLVANLTLHSGQQIRTGDASLAVLHLANDSTVRLGANSALFISELQQREDGQLVVRLMQQAGSTWHQVTPLSGPDSAYVVDTPSGAARVLGTAFSVAVAADGRTYFAVDEGKVTVTSSTSSYETVAVDAGYTLKAQPGQVPMSPLLYFRSEGELRRQNSTTWEIDDSLIHVTDETILSGAFAVGDFVEVTGRVLPNGRWQADSVDYAAQMNHQAAFAGRLQTITNNLWLINDISVLVTEATERPSDLAEGDLVRIVYGPQENGRRLAQRIERLAPAQNEAPEATATEPATDVTQPARPSLSFGPDELEVETCATQPGVIGALTNSGTPPHDVAADVTLDYQLLSGSQFVESVTITPSTWDIIAAEETVTFSVQIALAESWLAATEETEVKVRLFVAGESNWPGHHVTRLTITLIQTCGQTTTRTATPTRTMPPTAAATPIPIMTPTAVVGDCTGASPHPEGSRLAQIYNISYEEIMGWFCDGGFGFGEIDLAYSLSFETGTSVAAIFDMRSQGLGWGEIMQALGQLPGGGPPERGMPNPTDGEASGPPEGAGPPSWVTPDDPEETPEPPEPTEEPEPTEPPEPTEEPEEEDD